MLASIANSRLAADMNNEADAVVREPENNLGNYRIKNYAALLRPLNQILRRRRASTNGAFGGVTKQDRSIKRLESILGGGRK